MNRRIAHRPRYGNTQRPLHSPINDRQQFTRLRWSYRNWRPTYKKHALGYSLALIPLNHRLPGSIIVY